MEQFGKRVSALLILVAVYQLVGNEAATTPTTEFYCNVTYECSDPFTFDSTNSLKEGTCACREGWLRTSTCCLNQWWFIGLALGAGAIVLLALIIAIGCCCKYKSDAKKAKHAAKMSASHSNHKMHNDIELHDDIKSSHHHPAASTAAMMSFAANNDANHRPHDPTDKGNHHVVESHAVTPAHATPSAHGHDHAAPAHPVATAAAVAVVVHEPKDNDNHQNKNAHHDPTPSPAHNAHHDHTPQSHSSPKNDHQPQPRTNPQHHYQYQESRPYNRYQSQQAYQHPHTDPYYPASRHPPYGGGAYSNPRYSEDNESLETYDDTALPSTSHNNYSNSGPGFYNYDDQHGSSKKKPELESNSSLLKIDSTSQFVINRPSVHF